MWHRIIAEVLFIKPKLLCYWAGHPLLWRIDLMAPSKKTPQHLSSWMLRQYPTSRNTGTNPGSFKYFWQILHTFLLIAYNVIWWMLLLNKDNRFYVKNEVPPFSLLLADIDWRYMSYLKLLLLLLLPFFSFSLLLLLFFYFFGNCLLPYSSFFKIDTLLQLMQRFEAQLYEGSVSVSEVC